MNLILATFTFAVSLQASAYYGGSDLPKIPSTIPIMQLMDWSMSGENQRAPRSFAEEMLQSFNGAEKLTLTTKGATETNKVDVTLLEGGRFEPDATVPGNLLILSLRSEGAPSDPVLLQFDSMVVEKIERVSADSFRVTGSNASYRSNTPTGKGCHIEIERTLIVKVSVDHEGNPVATYIKGSDNVSKMNDEDGKPDPTCEK